MCVLFGQKGYPAGLTLDSVNQSGFRSSAQPYLETHGISPTACLPPPSTSPVVIPVGQSGLHTPFLVCVCSAPTSESFPPSLSMLTCSHQAYSHLKGNDLSRQRHLLFHLPGQAHVYISHPFLFYFYNQRVFFMSRVNVVSYFQSPFSCFCFLA